MGYFEDGVWEADGQVSQFAMNALLLLSLLFVSHPLMNVLAGIVIINEREALGGL